MDAYLGECLNMMVQALHVQDGTLPPGLTVQNSYTELRKGSKKAVVVVWNSTDYPQTLWKKTPVARAMAIQPVPKPPSLGVYRFRMKYVLSPKPQS